MIEIKVPGSLQVHAPNDFRAIGMMAAIKAIPPGHLPLMYCFNTIEGEALHVGRPRVLVRLAGCAVGCRWCDSVNTWKADNKHAEVLSVDEVVERVIAFSTRTKEVSITGGEPMHYPSALYDLAGALRQRGLYLNLETSGLIISHDVFSQFNTIGLDIKGPSSRVLISPTNMQMIRIAARRHPGVQLKFVVSSKDDLDWLLINFRELLDVSETLDHGRERMTPIVLTPCAPVQAGERVSNSDLQRTIDMILEWNRNYNIRVIAQQHKLLGYDTEEESILGVTNGGPRVDPTA